MKRFCAGTAVFALFLTFPLFCQTSSTAILGTVTDATGAVVVGAKVTLLQVQTGIKRLDTTSSTGDFNFPLLDPGQYSVTVEAPGFKTATNSGIQLELDLKARIDFHLEVGTEVRYAEEEGEKGPQASSVSVAGGHRAGRQLSAGEPES